MRFRLTIEYAGTRYSGWQVQKNARTVAGELSRAIETVTGTAAFELYGSGRTDAGVHALAQVAHLDLVTTLPPETIQRRINDELPVDINVLDVTPVRHTFHARHSARGRSYIYQVSRRRTAFAKSFVWWVKEPLDLARMRAVALQFQGFHDFRAFSDDDPERTSTQVQLDTLEIDEVGDLLVFRIDGSHFIWKMARRLVGVLVEVGRGGLAPDAATALLTTRSDRAARLTAPAAGLFLAQVRYDGDPRRPVPAASVVGPARPSVATRGRR
jgi:tRNA pseudouridine38-40 synthase